MQAVASNSSGGSLAVGRSAKSYAEGATAIGYDAMVQSSGSNAIAIGRSVITNYTNSIVLSASGSGITAPNAGVFVDSIRDESAGSPDKVLKYNTTTKELFYGAGGGTGSGTVTSVDVSGGTTGLTTSGGPVTTSGTITLAGTLAVANGGTGGTTVAAAQTNLQVDPAGTAVAMAIALG
jgi:hypothetical protein